MALYSNVTTVTITKESFAYKYTKENPGDLSDVG